MRTGLQRIRGAIGIGLMWAAAWAAVGGVPRWVLGIETDAPLPLVFGLFGLLAGTSFSAILAVTEGRRSFDQLSLPRVAAWGALGGAMLAALFARATSLGWGDLLALAATLAVASALCASGSLALARRAGERALPDGPAISQTRGHGSLASSSNVIAGGGRGNQRGGHAGDDPPVEARVPRS